MSEKAGAAEGSLPDLSHLNKILKHANFLSEKWGTPISAQPANWMLLALRLIIEHEPGMGFLKMPGAKPSAFVQDAMIISAFSKANAKHVSIRATALHLSKPPEFRGRTPGGIRSRFYKLMNPKNEEHRRLIRYLEDALANIGT